MKRIHVAIAVFALCGCNTVDKCLVHHTPQDYVISISQHSPDDLYDVLSNEIIIDRKNIYVYRVMYADESIFVDDTILWAVCPLSREEQRTIGRIADSLWAEMDSLGLTPAFGMARHTRTTVRVKQVSVKKKYLAVYANKYIRQLCTVVNRHLKKYSNHLLRDGFYEPFEKQSLQYDKTETDSLQ